MGDTFGAKLTLSIDESKVYIVRRKEDGKRYKIFHDGTEALIDETAERRATAVDEPEVKAAKEQ